MDVLYKLNQLINIVVCVECFCPQKESGLRGLRDPKTVLDFVKRYMKQSIKSQTFVAKRKKSKFEKNEILLNQNKISYYVMFGVELSLLGIRCICA